jgi:hypothetical protein
MDGKQIQEVTAEGIRYVDDSGNEQFIDFEACYQNYVRRRTSAEHWEGFKQLNHLTDADWDDHVEWVKSHKLVGARNILGCGGSPFLEFYTEPPTRFEFTVLDEFHRVCYLMRKVGWHTNDLT